MKRKRNFCAEDNNIAKAFFKMFLWIPTQSRPSLRVLLTNYEISLWQQTIWLADKRIGGVGIKTKLTVRK